jgi:deoxycytidylate deaminase
MKIIGRRHNDAFNKDCTYCVNEPGKCCGIHAEQSILWKMNELGFRKDEKDGCFIMLVSYSPCTTCANWILMSGLIDAVVYETLTEHDQRGVQLLRHHGVDVLDFNQIKMALDFGSNKALLNSEAREAVCDYARKWEEISRVG